MLCLVFVIRNRQYIKWVNQRKIVGGVYVMLWYAKRRQQIWNYENWQRANIRTNRKKTQHTHVRRIPLCTAHFWLPLFLCLKWAFDFCSLIFSYFFLVCLFSSSFFICSLFFCFVLFGWKFGSCRYRWIVLFLCSCINRWKIMNFDGGKNHL